jgi:hypothetical protein
LRSFGRNTLVELLIAHFLQFVEASKTVDESKGSDDDDEDDDNEHDANSKACEEPDDDDEEANESFLKRAIADLSGLAKAIYIKVESKDHLKVLGTLRARLAEVYSKPPPIQTVSVDTLCELCRDSPDLIEVPHYCAEPQEEMDKAVDKFFTLCFGQSGLFYQRFVENKFIPKDDVEEQFRAMCNQFQILNKEPEQTPDEKQEAEDAKLLADLERQEKDLQDRILKAKQKRKSSSSSKTGNSSSKSGSSSSETPSPSETDSSSSKRKAPRSSGKGSEHQASGSSGQGSKGEEQSNKKQRPISKKPKPIDELAFLQRHELKDEFRNLDLKVCITGLGGTMATASILAQFFHQFESTMEGIKDDNLLSIIQRAIEQFNDRAKIDKTIFVSEEKKASMTKICKRGKEVKGRNNKICAVSTKQMDSVLSTLTFQDRNEKNKKKPVYLDDDNDD